MSHPATIRSITTTCMPTDNLSRELHSFLVRAGLNPTYLSPQMEHYMEHLLYLLPPEEEDAVTHYYGLFGSPRLSLQEIAADLEIRQEDVMERMEQCVSKLAVTSEWQMMKQILKKI